MNFTAPLKMPSKLPGLFAAIFSSVIPLAGIFLFGWDWREIIIFYWLGNITVGVLAILSILRDQSSLTTPDAIAHIVGADDIPVQGASLPVIPPSASKYIKLFMAVFFMSHYGMFTLLHGVFVFAITSGSFTLNGEHIGNAGMSPLHYGQIFVFWIIATVIQIAYELLARQSGITMKGAYTRVITLHVSLIFGVFMISILHWPSIAAVLLVLTNLAIELRRSIQQHTSASAANLPVLP